MVKKVKKEDKKEGLKTKNIYTVGKRKRAIARTIFKPGKGNVTINTIPLERIKNEIIRLRIEEPLILAGWPKEWDIAVNVKGGGVMGQADAARLAIAKGIAQIYPDTKKIFLAYDRSMLIADSRRTEPHKPPHSSWGPRRYKQRSKR
jgi:small subunit ribosomal protein S9